MTPHSVDREVLQVSVRTQSRARKALAEYTFVTKGAHLPAARPTPCLPTADGIRLGPDQLSHTFEARFKNLSQHGSMQMIVEKKHHIAVGPVDEGYLMHQLLIPMAIRTPIPSSFGHTIREIGNDGICQNQKKMLLINY